MTRVKKGLVNHRKHKKYLKVCKGVYGRGNRCYRIGRKLYEKGMQYQYASRRINKRRYKTLFICVINSACKALGLSYSKFINLFNNHEISKCIDKKALSVIAQNNMKEFECIFNKVTNQGNEK